MKTAKRWFCLLAALSGVELLVRLGWTYENPIPVGMVWVLLVSAGCLMEALCRK